MLTDAEKVSIRRHLGLNSASPAQYPWVSTFFSVTEVLDTLPAAAETECRTILGRMTDIETRLSGDALDHMQVDEIGTITLRKEEARQLRGELWRWRRELSNLLGVPLAQPPGLMVVV